MPDTHNTQLPTPAPKKGRKPHTDFALYMDNLSDVPQPPTQETIDSYNEWLHNKGHKPSKPRDHLSKYVWRHGPLVERSYWLSQEAHDGLFKLAVRHHYARDVGTGRRQPLSRLIRAFANPEIEWVDNRDPQLKDADQACFELGLLPLWLLKEDRTKRRPRETYVTTVVEETLHKMAIQRLIIDREKPQIDKPTPTIGFLLEIIGRGLLVPTNLPDNPSPPKYPYQPPTPNYVINYAWHGVPKESN